MLRSAALAVAQAAVVYFPGNAVAKLTDSLALAIGAGLTAGISDNSFSTGELLVIATQFLAWAGAGAATKKPHVNVRGKFGEEGHYAIRALAIQTREMSALRHYEEHSIPARRSVSPH